MEIRICWGLENGDSIYAGYTLENEDGRIENLINNQDQFKDIISDITESLSESFYENYYEFEDLIKETITQEKALREITGEPYI